LNKKKGAKSGAHFPPECEAERSDESTFVVQSRPFFSFLIFDPSLAGILKLAILLVTIRKENWS